MSIKGILLGILAIVVLDSIAGIAMIPLFAENMSSEAIEALSQEFAPLCYSVFFGTISTIAGGYIAAKYGGLAPYKNAAVIGVSGLVFGVLSMDSFPLWFNVIGFISVIPAALFGAYLMVKKLMYNKLLERDVLTHAPQQRR